MSERIMEKGIPNVFDYLEHTSDIYIVAYGSNLVELFENAGKALYESMVKTSEVEPVVEKKIEAEGFDLENLLYQWLEELLFIYYSENIMCSEIVVNEITLARENDEIVYRIKGLCRGEEFNPDKHEPRVEIKAVTYHMMRILRNEDGWKAYFVLDI